MKLHKKRALIISGYQRSIKEVSSITGEEKTKYLREWQVETEVPGISLVPTLSKAVNLS